MNTKTCVIATVKNEGPWILEWVAHNRAIGFDHIVVGSNDCDDGTDLILDRLQQLGVLKHFDNTGPYPDGIQVEAYRKAMQTEEAKSADWVIALDADEFLNIHIKDGLVSDILAKHSDDTDGIIFNWRVFGDNGHSAFQDIPVCDAFTRANDDPEKVSQVKTLFRNNREYTKITPHGPWLEPVVNEAGEIETIPMKIRTAGDKFIRRDIFQMEKPLHSIFRERNSWVVAQVNHYIVKTKDVFDLKRKRGRAVNLPNARHTDSFFQKMNLNLVEDTSISRTADRRNEELAKFKQDAVLGDLHSRACKVLEQKIDAFTREAAELEKNT